VHRYRPVLVAAAAVFLSALSPHAAAADAASAAKSAAARKVPPDRGSIERGRYLNRT
jgi:hypothetical protein